jgi:hypothetical protein
MSKPLIAAAAQIDITPDRPQFLFGYPHVERISTGVHDRLLSSALFLSDGATKLLFVGNDVVAVGNDTVRRARERIERETGVPAANILIAATHTHSGPMTMDLLCCEADPVVPKADPHYIRQLEDGIVEAAVHAFGAARPAEAGRTIADGSCVGTNRHDPAGPSDPQVPVLAVRDRETHDFLATMVVCSMHPTVLHEDSTLVSGDFPATARRYLQDEVLGAECPVVYFTGPSGNQSPRHITKSNTFAEADRLGALLGSSIADSIRSLSFTGEVTLACSRKLVDLPAREFPPVDKARQRLKTTVAQLEDLRRSDADPRQIRTAECDWFGAEETLFLSQAAATGRLEQAVASVLPAEVSLLRVGPWAFAGWPGEAFVEFALAVKLAHPNCSIISLANGELQGYLVSREAVEQNWYEASNALFASPESGTRLVNATLELLGIDN